MPPQSNRSSRDRLLSPFVTSSRPASGHIRHRWISLLAATVACVAAHGTRADDSTTLIILQAHDRPEIHLHRWQEDWSVLADPALRERSRSTI